MKDKSFTQSASEREAAFEYVAAGLPSEFLNGSLERKRAIYGAFEARDARFDGLVYAAISSTGVYCRSVCPYHAKIENVTFYMTAAEAEEAGYRPCLVCRPETAPGLSSADAIGIGSTIRLRLGYRPPLRFEELLAFFRDRALAGVEAVDDTSYTRTVRITMIDGSEISGWMRVEHDPAHNALVLSIAESLLPATSMVVARVRRMFDLDCDPETVFGGLTALEAHRPGSNAIGTRLPGCFDPFETCCRAVLGQQVSVAAANKLAARIVSAIGPQIQTGIEGLDRTWPSASEVSALSDIAGTLGPLGVIRARSAVIAQIAHMVESGDLCFDVLADPIEQMNTLLSLKGIGPWTANYIAMRACSYPDAFLEKDSGVAHALPDMTPKERVEAVEPCRPWRSYAVICLWNSLRNQASQPKGDRPS